MKQIKSKSRISISKLTNRNGILVILITCFCVFVTKHSEAAEQWTQLGPFGGPIAILKFEPNAKNMVYAVTENGNVFVSHNGGISWVSQNTGLGPSVLDYDGMSQSIAIQDIDFDPENPAIVYALSSETKSLYKYDPTKNKWNLLYTVQNPSQSLVGHFAVDPFDSNHILMTGNITYKQVGDTQYTTKLIETKDGGVTWTDYTGLLPSGGKIVFSKTQPGLVITDTSISYDGGQTWSSIGLSNVLDVELAQSTTGTMYAVGNEVDNGESTVIYRSDDAGKTWKQIGDQSNGSPGFDYKVYIDPRNPDHVYVPLCQTFAQGIYETLDGGLTWKLVPVNFNACSARIAIDPYFDGHLIAGYYNLYSSWNFGQDYAISDYGITGRSIDAVRADNSDPEILYVGENYLNWWGQLFRSVDGGAHWEEFDNGRKHPGGGAALFQAPVENIALDNLDQARVYTGSVGNMSILDPSSQSWITVPASGYTLLYSSPLTAGRVYMTVSGDGDSMLWKSDDYGATWSELSDDSLYANATSGPIVFLAQSYQSPDVLYRSEVEKMWSSTDGGINWTESTTNLPLNGPIDMDGLGLYISPLNDTVLFTSDCNKIYRSVDSGTSWSTAYAPSGNCTVGTLYPDPTSPGTIYAGTTAGLVVSNDDGATWNADSYKGLEGHHVLVMDHSSSVASGLYAGTYDSGLFKLASSTDLAISIDGNSKVTSGVAATYWIKVVNTTSWAASPVALDVALPGDATMQVLNSTGATCNNEIQEIVCDLASLSGNAEWNVEISVTPGTLNSGGLVASVGSGQGDLNWSNNAAFHPLYVKSSDMALSLEPESETVEPNTRLKLFTVTVTNNGPDKDGASLMITSPSVTNGLKIDSSPSECALLGNGYKCNIQSISPGNSVTYTFTGSLSSGTHLSVGASVSPDNSYDPDMSNNASSSQAPSAQDGSSTSSGNSNKPSKTGKVGGGGGGGGGGMDAVAILILFSLLFHVELRNKSAR